MIRLLIVFLIGVLTYFIANNFVPPLLALLLAIIVALIAFYTLPATL